MFPDLSAVALPFCYGFDEVRGFAGAGPGSHVGISPACSLVNDRPVFYVSIYKVCWLCPYRAVEVVGWFLELMGKCIRGSCCGFRNRGDIRSRVS